MIAGTANKVLQALNAWYYEAAEISNVDDRLGAPHQWLFDVLFLEGVIGWDGRPLPDFTLETTRDILFLNIAMRQGNLNPQKKKK